MKTLLWHAVDSAPTPRAAVAWADARQHLLNRLQHYDVAELEQLTLVITAHCWIVLGDSALLPWAQGVQYAAPSGEATELWLPTHSHPDTAAALILQGLKDLHSVSPLLLWPSPPCVIPLTPQVTLSTALLATLQETLEA